MKSAPRSLLERGFGMNCSEKMMKRITTSNLRVDKEIIQRRG
jgi:hypothetical protein